ncbi:glucoamylase family protein [Phyllobacterium endophyticum]|uniref:Beta-glucosidase n=1 Tax=Phyllobacterium endophyticum TaxID=1149773 RepID=A0A2P7AU99_9HYPH|nr:glucoamylase family protein [Phyllobacterium endophyticum]PSH57804.1 beta-glucosidase [Phyllobacterium endophyticum]TYR44007.1 beta-glucosidase [Phyllobacterium endophyticum]
MHQRLAWQSSLTVCDSDELLLDHVQKASFRYFWDGAHPPSGLSRDRSGRTSDPSNDLVAIGGSGFGFMAILVAIERGWITRNDALDRFDRMLSTLERTTRYRGVFPHFINGVDGRTVPFNRVDDGGDLVETSLLVQGLICVRQYLLPSSTVEAALRTRIDQIWRSVQWNSHVKASEKVLYWHRSPKHDWLRNVPIRGWNEALITYILAAASPDHAIDAEIYHQGFAGNGAFLNGRTYYGVTLPLGPDYGGPLFFAHYSFCGLDPRGLKDQYADYWLQNCSHARINYLHSVHNPHDQVGYNEHCWGLTSSHGPGGYKVSSPISDFGLIAPTAALSSLPYLPEETLRALRYFATLPQSKMYGRFGFIDAFSSARNWFARTYLAINQGPVVAMIENYRSGLLWQLFMSAPELQHALRILGFTSPHIRVLQEQNCT